MAIILGYPGVGKSSVASRLNSFINLESSSFYINSVRDKNWYIYYCKIAEQLSNQGYDVFLSTHDVVRKELKDSKQKKFIVYPVLSLKTQWIVRLEERHFRSKLLKDYQALKRAQDHYDMDINELMNEPGFNKIEITYMPYNLLRIIEIHLWEIFEQ